MGYAKYSEDISDRYWESQAVMQRLEKAFLPGTFEPTPPPPTGWVRLTLNDSPLPDRIALLKGDEPKFNVETDIPGASFHASFVAAPSAELPPAEVSEKNVRFHLAQEGFYRLQLSCGSYHKHYEIDVTGTLDFDVQAPIQKGYLYLQDRPDEWTRDRLDSLKRLMIPANRPVGIPDSFCNGILDYHLALFHSECGNEMVANRRFEEAYKNLRPYIAHSDVARFICDYVLYLMNRFEGCSGELTRGHFGGLRNFLKLPYNDSIMTCGKTSRSAAGRYIEVLVLSIDQRILEVAREICDDTAVNLPSILASLENHRATSKHDAACQARMLVMLARGFRRLGEPVRAIQHYRQISQISAASAWREEANEFLSIK